MTLAGGDKSDSRAVAINRTDTWTGHHPLPKETNGAPLHHYNHQRARRRARMATMKDIRILMTWHRRASQAKMGAPASTYKRATRCSVHVASATGRITSVNNGERCCYSGRRFGHLGGLA